MSGEENQRIVLSVYGAAAEFWIDGQQFTGSDFYEFRRAPVVVTLAPGNHDIDVRVAHDVRAFGGVSEIGFGIVVELASENQVVVEVEKTLVADVLESRLVSEWASFPVRNESARWIEVLGVEGIDVSTSIF